MTVDNPAPAEVMALAAAIGNVLAGHPASLQGAALADCLATWLAGHDISGNKRATHKARAGLLALHCSLVRQLVPVNAKQIGTTP